MTGSTNFHKSHAFLLTDLVDRVTGFPRITLELDLKHIEKDKIAFADFKGGFHD